LSVPDRQTNEICAGNSLDYPDHTVGIVIDGPKPGFVPTSVVHAFVSDGDMIETKVWPIMKIFNEIQSEMRILGMLPVLVALGGWYLVRGDRLWRALRLHDAPKSHSFAAPGGAIVHLDRERARRRRS
jgi:hypothetical protein